MVNVRKRIREGEFGRSLMVGHGLDQVRTEPTTRPLFITNASHGNGNVN